MSVNLNKVTLIGNIGRIPEVRSTSDGQEWVTFSVATSEQYTDKRTNKLVSNTQWHRIVIFDRKLVEIAKLILHGGVKVYIEGSLRYRKWKDSQDNENNTTEVILNSFASKLIILSSRDRHTDIKDENNDNSSTSDNKPEDITDDKIPF